MRWRQAALLWIAALAIGCVAWSLWKVPTDSRTDRLAAGSAPLFAPNSVAWDEVDRIEVTRPDRDRLIFTRTDSRWRQVEPFDFPVESDGPQQLIADASALVALQVNVQTAASAAATGLDARAPTIAFFWGGREARVRLGQRLPGGRAWIDRPGGESVARLAAATLHDAILRRDLSQWRQTALFSRADIECDRIVCESLDRDGKAQRLEVARSGTEWMVVSPIATRADRASIERWLEALARAHATGFVADRPVDLMPFGLRTPAATVEIHSAAIGAAQPVSVVAQPAIERLEIGSPVRSGSKEHFARLAAHPDAIFEIDGTVVAAAIPPSLIMIDPTASGVRAQDIRAIRLEPTAGERVRLERAAGSWLLSAGSGSTPASEASVTGLLHTLCDRRASEIMVQKAPVELVVAVVVLESFDGRDLAKLTLSREPNGGRYGIDDGSGVLRIFPAATRLQLDRASYERDAAVESP